MQAKKVNFIIILINFSLGEEEASTEVVTLSEWMHESTMFNIITKLHFFKHYTESFITD